MSDRDVEVLIALGVFYGIPMVVIYAAIAMAYAAARRLLQIDRATLYIVFHAVAFVAAASCMAYFMPEPGSPVGIPKYYMPVVYLLPFLAHALGAGIRGLRGR